MGCFQEKSQNALFVPKSEQLSANSLNLSAPTLIEICRSGLAVFWNQEQVAHSTDYPSCPL